MREREREREREEIKKKHIGDMAILKYMYLVNCSSFTIKVIALVLQSIHFKILHLAQILRYKIYWNFHNSLQLSVTTKVSFQ